MSKKNKKAQPAAELEAPKMESSEPKIEFDEWWSLVQKKIPAIHHKEIIKADFRGRGLSNLETMEAFNKAIEMYGLKL
jgi:hypothetical protein